MNSVRQRRQNMGRRTNGVFVFISARLIEHVFASLSQDERVSASEDTRSCCKAVVTSRTLAEHIEYPEKVGEHELPRMSRLFQLCERRVRVTRVGSSSRRAGHLDSHLHKRSNQSDGLIASSSHARKRDRHLNCVSPVVRLLRKQKFAHIPAEVLKT